MPSRPLDPQENLVALITRHQVALHAYILPLLPNRAIADDVLQETNLVLWRKAAEYDGTRPFMPWASRIAFYQVKAARRDDARDRHVSDPGLLEVLASEDDSEPETTTALDHAAESGTWWRTGLSMITGPPEIGPPLPRRGAQRIVRPILRRDGFPL